MRNLLVTGGCGFIGSNYIRQLYEKGDNIQIVNLDKLSYAGNWHNLEGIPDSFHTLIEGDICDRDIINKIF